MSRPVGVLWTKKKKGTNEEFFSGSIDLGALGDVPVVIFKNTNKEKDSHPDYKIYISKTIEENGKPVEKSETVAF